MSALTDRLRHDADRMDYINRVPMPHMLREAADQLDAAANIIKRLSSIDDDTSLDGAPLDRPDGNGCLFCGADARAEEVMADFVTLTGERVQLPEHKWSVLFSDHKEDCPWVAALDFLGAQS